MKRFLALIVSLTFSCSSPEADKPEIRLNDFIVSKWQIGKIVYYYNEGYDNTVGPTYCDSQSSYTFLENNTIELIRLLPNDNGDCEIENNNFEYFNWNKIEDGVYKITSKKPNEQEVVSIENVTFEDYRMIWTDEFDDEQMDLIKVERYFSLQSTVTRNLQ